MRRFRWLSDDPVPAGFDLRRRGWTLLAAESGESLACPALLADTARAGRMHGAFERATTILVGITQSELRAAALSDGFGEALGPEVTLTELEQRALRVARALEAVPRRRRHGALDLDLLLRDGIVAGRRLGLHPREFGLLWRLTQSPGKPVAPRDLLAEVWRVNFRPETNSLAVHICRLRAKLASAGLAGIVSTTPDGCYAIAPAEPLAALRRRLTDGPAKGQSGQHDEGPFTPDRSRPA